MEEDEEEGETGRDAGECSDDENEGCDYPSEEEMSDEDEEEGSDEEGSDREECSDEEEDTSDDCEEEEEEEEEDDEIEEDEDDCYIGGTCVGCMHVDLMLSTQKPPRVAKSSPYGSVCLYL